MTETPDDSRPKQRRTLSPTARRSLIIAGVLLVVVLTALFIRYQTRGKYVEETNDAYLRADMVTVSPKIAGYVDQVFVADNQDVKAGQPLVRIDARDYRAQTAQYSAQIDVTRANVDNAIAGIREQEVAIEQARAELASARANAAFAAGEVERYAPLVASGAETREKLTLLRNQSVQAAKVAAAAAAATAGAERRVQTLRAQVREAQARGEAARAQLAAANVTLGSTIIRASVDGRIGDKSVRVGQFVTPGMRMMSVVPLRAIYVIANFKETQVGLMRPGQPATIRVDALPGVGLRGHVESIAPGTGAQFSLVPPQNATGNFTKIVQRVPVRIAVDAGSDVRRVLVPGLSVTAEVDTFAAKGDIARMSDQEQARSRGGR